MKSNIFFFITCILRFSLENFDVGRERDEKDLCNLV